MRAGAAGDAGAPAGGRFGEQDVLMIARLESVLSIVQTWIARRDDVVAAALVGSWAKGSQRPDSDIDLMLLASNPMEFRASTQWPRNIDWRMADLQIRYWDDIGYGAAWSRHVHLDPPLEIEFTFASPAWASIDPIDAGTLRVISDGCRIMWDPAGLLAKLRAAVASQLA
jgi:hypothetical protein